MVSIIIPNYNHEHYLKQRIDSILYQTYQDFEIIILDDCSPDNSRKVIEQYRSNRKVRNIIFNETNSGTTFKQWQKGIEIASGEYIWIAESDDWCEPNFLETLMKGITEKPNCVLSYCQSFTMANENVILWQSTNTKVSEYVSGKTFIEKYMINRNAIFNASMAIFKKEAYLKISNNYINFRFAGDWLFWIECARQGEVFISAKPLNFFRKHEKDVSGKVYANGYNFSEELKILQFLKKERIISLSQYKKTLLEKYVGFLYVNKKFTKDVRQNIRKVFHKNEDESYKFFLLTNSVKLKIKQKFLDILE